MNWFERIMEYTKPDFWLPFAERVRGAIIVLNFVFLAVFLVVLWIAFRDRPRATTRYAPHHGHKGPAKPRTSTLEDTLFLEQWKKVLKSFSTGSIDSLKLAIIEADKLADDTLRRFGLAGEHMADRLEKIAPDELLTLDRLWAAHRLRNEIVHTPGYELTLADARKVLDSYRAFFEEVGLLAKEEAAEHHS